MAFDTLPQITDDEWQDYQKKQWADQTNAKIGAIGFEAAANDRIASLTPPPPSPPQESEAFRMLVPAAARPASPVATAAAPAPAPPPPVEEPPAEEAPPPSASPAREAVQAARPAISPPVAPAAPPSRPSAVTGVPAHIVELIQRHAPEDLKNNPDFIRTVAAGAKAESGWDYNSVQRGFQLGSGQGARGLFQFDMGGMGAGFKGNEQALLGEKGAELQASHIIPLYAKAYRGAPQALTGGEKASWVAGQAERPKGYDDPNSAARRGYASAFGEIEVGAGVGRTTTGQPSLAAGEDISQFGDPQLTASEAYAACGPAAAVRFAQRYGRNPTLREAVDLAKGVGWTSQQGMAGIGSQQALLKKMGIETQLVGGANWERFAQEAQTGNPVTISTSAHYFYADGYNPQTRQFHVGRSGMDLKGGKEWMTQQEIEAAAQRLGGGTVQGGLIANMPGAPSTSTAGQDDNPMDWLGKTKDRLLDTILPNRPKTVIGETIEEQSAKVLAQNKLDEEIAALDLHIDRAREGPLEKSFKAKSLFEDELIPTGRPESIVERIQAKTTPPVAEAEPEETDPLKRMSRGIADAISTNLSQLLSPVQKGVTEAVEGIQSPETGNPLADIPGTAASALGTGVHAALEGVRNVTPTSELARGVTGMEQVIEENRPLYDRQMELVRGFADAQDRGDVDTMNQIRQEMDTLQAQMPNAGNRDVIMAAAERNRSTPVIEAGTNIAGGLIAAPLAVAGAPTAARVAAAAIDPLTGLPSLAARGVERGGAAVERAAGDVLENLPTSVREFAEEESGAFGWPSRPKPAGYDPAASSNPVSRSLGEQFDARPPAAEPGSIGNRAVRAWTNRYEAADRMQEDVLRQIPHADLQNPDPALDLSANLRRLAGSDTAAEQRIEETLGPAIRAAEEDLPALKEYLTHRNVMDIDGIILRTEGIRAAADRIYPGGHRIGDHKQAFADLRTELGPARWARVEEAAKGVYQYRDDLIKRAVDSGLVSTQEAANWAAETPGWVPTRILDHLDETGSGAPKAGSNVSVANDGFRSYTKEGTASFREDPIASLIGFGHSIESRARRNEAASALVNLDQRLPAASRVLRATSDAPHAGEPIVQRLNNGIVERYIAPREMAAVVNGPNVTQAPGFMRHWTNFVRNVSTVLSPAFALVTNPSVDIPTSFARMYAREGGNPTAVPRLMGNMAKGYLDAFQGFDLAQGLKGHGYGEWTGPGAREFRLEGGGQSGMVQRTVEDRSRAVSRLAREPNEIRNLGDLGRTVRSIFDVVPAVAERMEAGPRIAGMRQGQQMGRSTGRSVLAGRTASLDFDEGGTLAKTLNQFIPFFNVGIQGGPLTLTRAFRENRAGAALTAVQLIGAPVVAAEAWNRSNAQRSKDYDDIPEYIKSQGVVVMMPEGMPGGISTDKEGNRIPNFQLIRTGAWSPLVVAARDAAHRTVAQGPEGSAEPKDWQELLGAMLQASASGPMGAVTDMSTQLIPGAGTYGQLAMNRDVFRGRNIVSKQADEDAPRAARDIADALTTGARMIDPKHEIHPSQVDFAVKDVLGGVGSSLTGLYEMMPGGEPQEGDQPQKLPVVGGLLKAAGFRGDVGETGRKAREQGLAPDVQRYLQSEGIEYVPGPIDREIGRIELTRAETTTLQQLTNQYVDEALRQMRDENRLKDRNQGDKQRVTEVFVAAAKAKAARDLASEIPEAEYQRRVEALKKEQEAGKR